MLRIVDVPKLLDKKNLKGETWLKGSLSLSLWHEKNFKPRVLCSSDEKEGDYKRAIFSEFWKKATTLTLEALPLRRALSPSLFLCLCVPEERVF